MFELCGVSPCNTYGPVRVWLLHVTFGHNCHSAGSFAALGSQFYWKLNATGTASFVLLSLPRTECYKHNIECFAHRNLHAAMTVLIPLSASRILSRHPSQRAMMQHAPHYHCTQQALPCIVACRSQEPSASSPCHCHHRLQHCMLLFKDTS